MSAQKAADKTRSKSGAASKKGGGRSSGSNSGSKGGSNNRSGNGSNGGTAKAAAEAKDAKVRPAILDTRLKRELIGIFIAILAIALFIAVVAPGTAVLSRGVSDTFRLVFGLGAFALPFLMLLWAISFFVEQPMVTSTARLAIGLVIIFLSALSIIGLMTPGAVGRPDLIFAQEALVSHGGYTGGGIAWALLELVGQAISLVILIGLVILGAVLIGFSITGIISRFAAWVTARRDRDTVEFSGGAYNMGDGDARMLASPQGRGGLIPATARLSNNMESTQMLEVDFSEGDQGRLPLQDLGSLGSTRRLVAEGEYNPSGGPEGMRDETVLLGPGVTVRPRAATRAAVGAAGAVGVAAGADAMGGDATGAVCTADATGAFATATPPHVFWTLPDMKLLKVSRNKTATKAGEMELRQTAAILQATIDQFGVEARVEGWVAGPTVTLFKVSLGEGVRLNKINALDEDIALALAAPAVRIFSPIPGTTLVGIEVPNVSRSMILLGDVLPSAGEGLLQLAIGKDVEGSSIVANLEKMPHLLIGGTTGSGKSVAVNSMIMSILMRTTPKQVRMILIDPKMVELSLYNDIPHLYVPVVTDAQKAASALAWGVMEMERRLKLFQKSMVKNAQQYNAYVREEQKKAAAAAAAAEARAARSAAAAAAAADGGDEDMAYSVGRVTARAPKQEVEEEPLEELPLIVIVIDELADLMMIAGKDVETSISRLAQLARAAGLHLIIATQRPSTNVITGLIKANIVNRIAFSVASGIDSRVIIDGPGAEDLIGNGDLLFSRPEYGKPQRIQGCFVSEAEIESVVEFLKEQAEPEYHEDILTLNVGGTMATFMGGSGGDGEDDPLVWEAADIVVSSGFGSTSTLQRRLKVGYARAGRIMDLLEQKGIVGPPNGSKPREVFMDDVLELESLKALEAADGKWS